VNGALLTILLIFLIVLGVFLCWCLGQVLDWLHENIWGKK
jgi:hypothetical protein